MNNHKSQNTFEWNLNKIYPRPENKKIQMDLNDGTYVELFGPRQGFITWA